MSDDARQVAVASHETPPNDYSRMLMDVIRLSMSPEVDGAKTTALAELAMKMQDREAERRFRMAKHKAIMEMPRISKTGAIIGRNGQTMSRYARFEDMDRAVRPILARHNLVITFNVNHQGQMVTVQPILSYSDGEMTYTEYGGEMALAIDTTGAKNATQGAGSAASYGKRHSMKAMLNIIEDGEDDDGGATITLDRETVALIEAAREAARGGTAKYEAFFKGLTPQQKGFLVGVAGPDGVTYHERCKEAAKAFD
jgi:hypothetical protein